MNLKSLNCPHCRAPISLQNKRILLSDEKLLLYKSAAILEINKLQTGMFLTDQRVGYTYGRKAYSLRYDQIHAIEYEVCNDKFI